MEQCGPEGDSPNAFYASIESAGAVGSKTSIDGDMNIYWDGDEELSIFNHGTRNSHFIYNSRPGGNSGSFYPKSEDDATVGTELPYAYAVYPYSEDMSISTDGVVSMNLPAIQKSRAGSLGPGANAMMAVSENNLLMFKNLCGYLAIQLTGADCSLASITLKANGGESIAGSALVSMPLGGVPEVSLQKGTDEISLEFDTDPEVSSSYAREFLFVVPPVTLTQGFTVTITDEYGGTFSKSYSKEIVISRNKISRMEPLSIELTYDDFQTVADAMYKSIGQPCKLFDKPDDLEILLVLFSNDLESADAIMPASSYNWFSVCGEYNRLGTYRNTSIRYYSLMNMIALANKFIALADPASTNEATIYGLAQIRAMRAWCYMLLANNYQFPYLMAQDQPCVPLVTENTDDPNNTPRATVAEVYDLVLSDLNFAVEKLDGFVRTSKAQIDVKVAHGLRARANLEMGNWEAAFNDAYAAANGFEPASIAEVSKPAFCDISEHNWIWGFDMTPGMPTTTGGNGLYATTSSWLRSFSGHAYATSLQVYCCINKLLWDKIPDTDVRKGWWVDENLASPLLDGLTWPDLGEVATADDGGSTKLLYLPYTNVKFACNPIATMLNEEDMPLMRVEEMILIMAEAKAHTDQATAAAILNAFVQTYRDPSYAGSNRNLLDEIWFQRRVELWGEGFGIPDVKRLGKPVVRFHDQNTNVPYKYRFNIPANDPLLLMPFPSNALQNNTALEDNPAATVPTSEQNPELRDGVTD